MNIETIQKSPRRTGKNELLAFMAGKKLSYKKAVNAKCFECMGGYVDGAFDCGVKTCPLRPFMPYLNVGQQSV